MGNVYINESMEMISSTEEIDKNNEYMDYINNHVNNVIKNFNLYFDQILIDENEGKPNPVLETISFMDLKDAILEKKLTIRDHDASKYDDIEFYGYRLYYHPTEEEKNRDDEYHKKVEEDFELAWKHHYENNSHHIEYWYDWNNSICKDMDLESIIEMLCDWLAMSDYFHSSTLEWWNGEDSEKERSMMTENTRSIINELLTKIIFK